MSRSLLSSFSRIPLAHLPTPLEPLERLSKTLGGPQLYIKRDDCTGLATGGNKTRKLEFLMGDALGKGADIVLTAGGLQSNHARQTAAAAARCGLACELFLEAVPGTPAQDYDRNGNLLLDRMLGAAVHRCPSDGSLLENMAARAEELHAEGRKPYVVPVGGSNGIGALGYVDCALELLEQASDSDLEISHIVMATGSGGTQAGLLAGLRAAGSETSLIGINVSASEADQKAKLQPVLEEAFALLDLASPPEAAVICDGGHYLPGYGIPSEATLAAVKLVAETEAILLDPVYTGKAMAGLIAMIRAGELTRRDKVVFLHTGGAAGLFAYETLL